MEDKNIIRIEINGTPFGLDVEKARTAGAILPVHRVGNVYADPIDSQRGLYLLSQVKAREVTLIALYDDANRFRDPVDVKNVQDITPQEFALIGGDYSWVYIGRIDDFVWQSRT